ncbi:MAG: UDP-N-acetylmuramate dehydrogenase [Deltaproteobacteria bacterium]|nr:UDP-N-acetylmuramate dehydrogenase [Deltaproteobacteria bacterium]
MAPETQPAAKGALFADVGGATVTEAVPLGPLTTFEIGGPAQLVVVAETLAALTEVVERCRRHALPLLVLGGGSNLLVSDRGVAGVALRLGAGFDYVRADPNATGGAVLEVGAATSSAKTLRRAARLGLSGLEMLAGVPGSIGGALVMNAGGREGEIGAAVRRVQVLEAGARRWIDAAAAGFGYRHSAFPQGAILVAVELDLRADLPEVIGARVHAAVDRRRATQPLHQASAGSVFKNPPGRFAGQLIEAAGCKGLKEGGAEVSERHANFIVNTGEASAADVLRLIREVQRRVLAHAGVSLELELRLVGDFAEGGQP